MKGDKKLQAFKTLASIGLPSPIKVLPKILISILLFFLVFLTVTPWIQTSKGFGYVIAIDPGGRAQNINAPFDGRISKWYVRDGQSVKAGDKLVEVIDNDPLILERLRRERDAKQRKYNAAQIASETAKLNYDRQEELHKRGLSARKEYERAKIEYKRLLGIEESATAELTSAEVKLSRQERQVVVAPRDGTILKVLAGDNSTVVRSGDKIATFAPNLDNAAVEIYVRGNDIPLIHKGRKVRLQFEGWPVVQFSGWPSVAIGTFGGIVSAVDASVSNNGKFRVIVTKEPGEEWPDSRFLRHGAKVYGWVLLNEVSVGYELWRQINSFPPNFDKPIMEKGNNKILDPNTLVN